MSHSPVPRLFFVAACLTCLLAGVPGEASAQGVQRIAAVVNEEIISVFDLENRLRLVMTTSGLPNDAETRRRLQPQVLRILIDERLQQQEADRMSATVPEREISEAIGRIEQANRMPPGALFPALQNAGVDRSALTNQIKAALAWQKVVQRRLRPSLQVGQDEVDEVIARINNSKGTTEYLLAEIFLAVETPEQEDEVKQRLEDMLGQMSRGATFPGLAQQFSQSASASSGGDIGWVERGQLDDEVLQILDAIQPGRVSAPIRTPTGYYLFAFRDKRILAAASPDEAQVTLAQLVLPLEPNAPAAEVEVQKELAETVRESVLGCDDLKRAAKELNVSFVDPTPELKVADLAPTIRSTVASLKTGEAAKPVQNDAGIALIMVCQRKEPETHLPSRDEISENLTRQRLDIVARRHLRDLRRQAFIDVRV